MSRYVCFTKRYLVLLTLDASWASLGDGTFAPSEMFSPLFHNRYLQEKQDYEKRVQQRIGSDRFASRYAQTVNWALKTKEVGY